MQCNLGFHRASRDTAPLARTYRTISGCRTAPATQTGHAAKNPARSRRSGSCSRRCGRRHFPPECLSLRRRSPAPARPRSPPFDCFAAGQSAGRGRWRPSTTSWRTAALSGAPLRWPPCRVLRSWPKPQSAWAGVEPAQEAAWLRGVAACAAGDTLPSRPAVVLRRRRALSSPSVMLRHHVPGTRSSASAEAARCAAPESGPGCPASVPHGRGSDQWSDRPIGWARRAGSLLNEGSWRVSWAGGWFVVGIIAWAIYLIHMPVPGLSGGSGDLVASGVLFAKKSPRQLPLCGGVVLRIFRRKEITTCIS